MAATAPLSSTGVSDEAAADDRRIIYCQATIRSVSDVDTIEQTYTVKATYKLRWIADPVDIENWSRIEQQHEQKASGVDATGLATSPDTFVPAFVPKLIFPNSDSAEICLKGQKTEFYTVERSRKGTFVVFDFQVYAVFHDRFELEHFPFDCQGIINM